jgi:hypothetical protein
VCVFCGECQRTKENKTRKENLLSSLIMFELALTMSVLLTHKEVSSSFDSKFCGQTKKFWNALPFKVEHIITCESKTQ